MVEIEDGVVIVNKQDRSHPVDKKRIQQSSMPRGDVAGWAADLRTNNQIHLTAKKPEPNKGPENKRFHIESHLQLGDEKVDYTTTSADTLHNKGGVPAKMIPQSINSHVPRGDVNEAEWAADATSMKRLAYIDHGLATRKPFDPKLQGSHFSLGTEKNDYATTTALQLVEPDIRGYHKPSDLRSKKNASNLPQGDRDAWKRDLATSSQLMFKDRGFDPATKADVDFHGATTIQLGDDAPSYTTTSHSGHDGRRGAAARPIINKAVSSLPKGDVPADEWGKDLKSMNTVSLVKHASGKRTPFNPNLQATQFSLGSEKTDYQTVQQISSQLNATGVPARVKTQDPYQSSFPKGDEKQWAEDLASNNTIMFMAHQKGITADRNMENQNFHKGSDFRLGDDKVDYHTTTGDDFVKKDGRRPDPIVLRMHSNLPKGNVSADEWGKSLQTTKEAAFKNHGSGVRTKIDPNLQGTQFVLGTDKPEYNTTTGDLKSYKFKR